MISFETKLVVSEILTCRKGAGFKNNSTFSSANATPDFEGRGGDNLAEEIANSLTAAYKSKSALDLSQLCILKGKKCWKLYLDILVKYLCVLYF